MKKLTVTLILLLALFTVNFADDGHTGGDGKACPNGQQTCLAIEPETEPVIIKTLKIIFDVLI